MGEKGWLEGLQLYYEERQPPKRIAYLAVKYGHIAILDWLEQKGALPNEIPLRYINFNDKNREEVLAWLAQRGIYPS